MLVECTVHIGSVCLIMICLLASPAQLFLLKAANFLLHFVIFNFVLLNFSISAISSLSEMVALFYILAIFYVIP